MIKDEIPRGQLSTIILTTLEERDKYGYEIIDEVLNNTDGKVSIKQPSLYSSLKRMEEQALISSYWRDSDIGGRRHYYHLTDLGKKHLEKWKEDLPKQYLTQSQEESHTRVLQQENLFNLANNSVVIEEKQPEEPKKDNAFVQFDLFTNSTMVTPFAQEEKNEKQEQVQSNNLFIKEQANVNDSFVQEKSNPDNFYKQSITQNPILTSYEKPIEKKEYAFDYVKKTNKSFSDSFKSYVDYEKKYVEKKFDEQSDVQTQNVPQYFEEKQAVNLQQDKVEECVLQEEKQNCSIFYDDSLNKSNDVIIEKEEDNKNNFIKEEISNIQEIDTSNNSIVEKQNLQKNKITSSPTPTQKEEPKDDGVFITERLSIDDMPKPAKWDKRRFEVYLTANSVAPDLKRKHSDNYEDRIKDLYEQSKSNAENRELELIDDKVKFNSYKALQEFYKEQNIKFKPFEKTLKTTQKDYNMVRTSKLNMLSALFIFLYMCVISTAFGIIGAFVPQKLNSPFIYFVLPIICLGIFVYYLVEYIKTPQKRVAFDINKYKFKTKTALICLLLIPIILSLNLIFGFTFTEFSKYLTTIIYPIFIVLIYFVYYPFKKLLLRSKSIY